MDPVTNIEALWQIIDTKYCYVEQKGVDWNAIHDDYIAKAKNIGSDQVKLFDLCAQMLDTLHDGHVNLISYFDQSYNTTWYDAYPANFDTDLQKLYLKDYRIGNGLCGRDLGLIFRFFLWIVFYLVLILLFFYLLGRISLFDLSILYLHLYILEWFVCFVLLFLQLLAVHNGQ